MNNTPRDWRDSVIIGSLTTGIIIIAGVLVVRSQPQSPSIVTASNSIAPSSSTNTPSPQQIQQSFQQAAINPTLPKMEAVAVINRYLSQKSRIFASPYDRQLVASVLTGNALYDATKPGGSMDWLQQRNAYYRYGLQKAEPLAYYSVNSNWAQIEVKVTEELSYYENGALRDSGTNVKDYRFTMQQENGTWKISERQAK